MNSIIYLGIDVHGTNFTFCALSVTLGKAPTVIAENQTEANDLRVLVHRKMVESLKKQYGDNTKIICGYAGKANLRMRKRYYRLISKAKYVS